MMANPTIEIFDAATGENQVRQMSDEEWSLEQERRESNDAIASDKIAKKQTVQAKLIALGLTADDLKVLGL